jgi:hypothetical protein
LDGSLNHWISENYDYLMQQTKTMLYLNGDTNINDQASTILNEILIRILEKPKDNYYHMIANNKMRSYVVSAISTNVKSITSPHQYGRRRYKYTDNVIYLENKMHEQHTDVNDHEQMVVDKIYSILNSTEELKQIYGTQWRYFKTLLLEYIEPEANNRTISRKLNIPYHQIVAHLLYARSQLYNYLKQHGYHLSNYTLNYKLRCSLSKYSKT